MLQGQPSSQPATFEIHDSIPTRIRSQKKSPFNSKALMKQEELDIEASLIVSEG